jgi:hypothetical protein
MMTKIAVAGGHYILHSTIEKVLVNKMLEDVLDVEEEEEEEEGRYLQTRSIGKMQSYVLGLAMMATSLEGMNSKSKGREFIPPEPPKKVIPKGCQEFQFAYGEGKLFECIAISKKSAEVKFKKHLKKLK